MSAMEKSSWFEFLISFAVIVVVSCTFPFWGDAASGTFGFMGLFGLIPLFFRKRGKEVVVDERDLAIDRKARGIAVSVAWMALFMTLMGIVLYTNYSGGSSVSTRVLNWLLWIQLALFFCLKGIVGVVEYRRHRLAA